MMAKVLGMATKKAIMHGIVRGMVHAGQGGKFGAGFASGFVSSSLSVGNKGYGNIYSRTAIMAVVGGTTSVITGGKFANGAESGAFVHLFNAEGGFSKISEGISSLGDSITSFMKEHVGGNFMAHFILVGVHGHATAETYSLCVRGGPGLMLSAGPEVSATYTSNEITNNWSGGVGADAALGTIDGGASVLVNDNSINASVAYRGFGLGFSAGGDLCYSGKW